MDTISLADLKAADLPHATCKSIGLEIRPTVDTVGNRLDARKLAREVNEYLHSFIPEPKCPACETDLGGLLGSFTWGIVAGEGFCGCCRYPVRGHHRLSCFDDVLSAVLPYHPSVLKSAPEPVAV